MSNGVEIYLRHSAGQALLMFHVPSSMREAFITAIQSSGIIDGRQIPIIFEAPVRPEWTPGPDDPRHMRVAVDQISIQFSD